MSDVITSNTKVPFEGNPEASIVLIGEAPGNFEREQRRPFIGPSGEKLETVLLRNGLKREDVYLTNLCKYQPVGNDFERLEGSPYLLEGINELRDYFKSRKTKPIVVVPLDTHPLKHVTEIQKGEIQVWRGSILRSPWEGLGDVKIIPTLHPANLLYDSTNYPIFDFDIRRIAADSKFADFNLPQREFVIVDCNPMLLEEVTKELLSATELSVDIENFGPRLACVGFAAKPERGFCIVWDGTSHTRDCITRILSSKIPKIFQFGTHDTNFLKVVENIQVENYSWDTLVAAHTMYPELPKSLAFLTSIYTREPFYKYEGRVVEGDEKSWSDKIDRARLWRYNIKDACCTLEVKRKQEVLLKNPNWAKTFNFEMSMLPVAHSISQTGMKVDVERLHELQNECNNKIAESAALLDGLTGGFISETRKKKQKTTATRTQVSNIMYKILGLPERKKRNKKGEENLTTEEDAIVSLIGVCVAEMEKNPAALEWKRKHAVLFLILRLRGLEKAKGSYLDVPISSDSRIRGTYKVAGSETGRWAAEKWVDGTGNNPQTFPRGEL